MERCFVIKENPQKKLKTIIKRCLTITFYNQVFSNGKPPLKCKTKDLNLHLQISLAFKTVVFLI